jgi:hypothetical protein
MMMIKNEKGYGLVVTMLVATMVGIIGLTVVAASLQGSIRTELRETDINITYETKKVLEQMIADLRLDLSKKRLPADILKSSLFENHLNSLIDNLEVKYNDIQYEADGIKNVEITDVSSQYNIDSSNFLTRVLEISLVTTNPEENQGEITRKIKKRVILSPLPSFLQYAVGSLGTDRDSGLILNGSPTLQGNIYARRFQIDQLAQFWPSSRANTEKPEYIFTPYPEVIGDVYSNSPNLFFDGASNAINKESLADYFYEQQAPAVKNDSNFIEINFNETFKERTNKFLQDEAPALALNEITIDETAGNPGETIQNNLKTKIGSYLAGAVPQNSLNAINISDLLDILLLDGDTQLDLNKVKDKIDKEIVKGNFDLSNVQNNTLESLNVIGDLSLNSIQDLTLSNGLFVNGSLTLSNYANSTLNAGKLFASGDITIFNKGGTINISEQLASSGTIRIINEAGGTIKLDYPSTGTIISHNIEMINKSGSVLLSKPMVTSGKLLLENSGLSTKMTLDNDSFIGGDVLLRPLDSTIAVTGNVITGGSFSIIGNDDNGQTENDNTSFNSVVYALGSSLISNVNIKGDQTGQGQAGELILLSKKDLAINRINEFTPLNKGNIASLKGFFYTEDSAELFGVGSMFYIDGGIFSKKKLIINAVRGDAENENSLLTMANTGGGEAIRQADKYSRFNVTYNKEVLLKKIDALPLVDSLQVIPDHTTIK